MAKAQRHTVRRNLAFLSRFYNGVELHPNRGFRVELEKDLSLKRLYLDMVIVEREDGCTFSLQPSA